MRPKCIVNGCNKPNASKGLCTTHIYREKHGLAFELPIKQYNPTRLECAVVNCSRISHAKGLCSVHDRMRKAGLDYNAPLRQRSPTWEKCKVPGCKNMSHFFHGLCGTHQYRMQRHGSYELPAKPKKKCVISKCNLESDGLGYCDEHRKRLLHSESYNFPISKDATLLDPRGYRKMCLTYHPNAQKGSHQIFEHTLVMSNIIGRPLRKGETVHHKNGLRGDNRPSNLELRTTNHGRGQSVLDMLKFCREYIQEYGHLESALLENLPSSESSKSMKSPTVENSSNTFPLVLRPS